VHKLNNGQVINPVPYDGKAGAWAVLTYPNGH
jgi:hypothetical protein